MKPAFTGQLMRTPHYCQYTVAFVDFHLLWSSFQPVYAVLMVFGVCVCLCGVRKILAIWPENVLLDVHVAVVKKEKYSRSRRNPCGVRGNECLCMNGKRERGGV